MFDSLDAQMKHDEAAESTTRERILRWALIGVVSVTVFGGLFILVRWFSMSG
jgi:lipid-A-disaccharide synthase-like uncharacterized protein